MACLFEQICRLRVMIAWVSARQACRVMWLAPLPAADDVASFGSTAKSAEPFSLKVHTTVEVSSFAASVCMPFFCARSSARCFLALSTLCFPLHPSTHTGPSTQRCPRSLIHSPLQHVEDDGGASRLRGIGVTVDVVDLDARLLRLLC